jgi:glycosyltransferase involved in cell wall biosynthesis
VVAVGRLSVEKGFDLLVEAVAQARANGVDVSANIVGEGPERDRLAAQAEGLGVAEWVRLVGPVPHERLGEVFAPAHAAVAPSRREGLGLAALDALAAGRPVITARVGGLPEAVADGVDGVLVAPGDPAELADALGRLPLPPPRGDLLAEHDPAAVTQAHLDLYEKVTRGASGG